jgi:hypothetical protein
MEFTFNQSNFQRLATMPKTFDKYRNEGLFDTGMKLFFFAVANGKNLCFFGVWNFNLPPQRPVPDTKRGPKTTLIAYTSPRYCRSILLGAGHWDHFPKLKFVPFFSIVNLFRIFQKESNFVNVFKTSHLNGSKISCFVPKL